MKLRFDLELNQDSYYEASAIRPPTLPALVGSLSCDVCVLGGGLAGLSAALELARQDRTEIHALKGSEPPW